MNTVIKQEGAKPKTMANFLNDPKQVSFLDNLLKDKRAEFTSNLIALTKGSKELELCTPASLMKCALNAVALNLPLNKNLGFAYAIAYRDTKTNAVIPQF